MSDWPPGCTCQWVREPGSKKTRYMRRPSSPPRSSRRSSQTLPVKWPPPNNDVTLPAGCTSMWSLLSLLVEDLVEDLVEPRSKPMRCRSQFLSDPGVGDRPVLQLPGGFEEPSLQLQGRCEGQHLGRPGVGEGQAHPGHPFEIGPRVEDLVDDSQ